MREFYEDLLDEEDALWEQAYEWALQRAREEGDVDPDDDDRIFAWVDEYYEYLKG